MRRVATLVCLMVLLTSGCAGQVISGPTPTPEVLGVTLPPPSPTPRIATMQTNTPEPTFTPAPSPTPIMYVVKSGDTLLGIAIEYGTTVAAIQQANGIINPAALQPGQELIIPLTAGSIELAKQLLPTPTPVEARVQGLRLYETSVGSLWCLGEVFNPNERSLENVQVRIVLKDASGQVLAEAKPFTIMDVIPPGGQSPFGSLFTSPPARYASFEATIIRAEPSTEPGGRYAALQITSKQGGTDGLQFRVFGKARNSSDKPATGVKIIVTAYDAAGNVIGYRQQTLGDGNLAAGATSDFSVTFAPSGGTVAHFEVAAEGRFAQ
jgi:LysM repeat protein